MVRSVDVVCTGSLRTEPLWKLFYADRTTFSSDDGEWADAPAWGVMGVAHVDDEVGYSRDAPGPHGDFYILASWMRGQPMVVDAWGLMHYLIKDIEVMSPEDRLTEFSPSELVEWGVKFGQSVPNDVWREVCSWMDSDPQLPRKSARYAHERA